MNISYRKVRYIMACAVLLGLGITNALAQNLMIYPAAGQSPQQQ